MIRDIYLLDLISTSISIHTYTYIFKCNNIHFNNIVQQNIGVATKTKGRQRH